MADCSSVRQNTRHMFEKWLTATVNLLQQQSASKFDITEFNFKAYYTASQLISNNNSKAMILAKSGNVEAKAQTAKAKAK